MSKKKLDTAGIENELRGASLFFSRPEKPEVEAAPLSQTDLLPSGSGDVENEPRTPARVNTRTHEHTNARTGERTISRQSYNVFADQHQALKQLEAKGTLSGKGVFISEMVRDALDEYLKKKE